MNDYFGVVLTGAVIAIGLFITYACYLARKVDSLNDTARTACIDVYEEFNSDQLDSLPISVRRAWEAGCRVKLGE